MQSIDDVTDRQPDPPEFELFLEIQVFFQDGCMGLHCIEAPDPAERPTETVSG
jgi:hypothetical protein